MRKTKEIELKMQKLPKNQNKNHGPSRASSRHGRPANPGWTLLPKSQNHSPGFRSHKFTFTITGRACFFHGPRPPVCFPWYKPQRSLIPSLGVISRKLHPEHAKDSGPLRIQPCSTNNLDLLLKEVSRRCVSVMALPPPA